jgi:UDP-N-acetylmuramoylalanine--D-glutamate ligase
MDWSGIAALVLSPGVPLTHPAPHWTVEIARSHGVEVIGDIELFCRERRKVAPGSPFVAITGTNGKSTTTALIAHLFASAGRSVALGGNIGTAILSLDPPSPDRVHVVECSSYQIDLAPTIDPSVAVILNVTEDHLDRHGTIGAYAAVKERLAARAGTAVIGVDDDFTRAMADRAGSAGRRLIRVSVEEILQQGLFAEGTDIVRASGGRRGTVLSLAGNGALRGSPTAWNRSAGRGASFSSTTPRRRMPMRRRRPWPPSPRSIGSQADGPRLAASRAWRASSRG